MIFIACTTNQSDIQMHDNDQLYNSFVKRKKMNRKTIFLNNA